jgi:hypothetical protein
MTSLDPPPGVELDPDAKELSRLWAANKKLNIAISIGVFAKNGKDEAKCWGLVLSDFTRHVARALSQQYGGNEEQVTAEIREMYLKELAAPTSGIHGQ